MLRQLMTGALLIAIGCGGSKKAAEKPADPNAKLTHEQCERAVNHAVELMKADPKYQEALAGMKDTAPLVEQCLATAVQKDYDCIMASKVADDMGKCEPPAEHREGPSMPPSDAPATN